MSDRNDEPPGRENKLTLTFNVRKSSDFRAAGANPLRSLKNLVAFVALAAAISVHCPEGLLASCKSSWRTSLPADPARAATNRFIAAL
jgi:hypothetical protein